MQQIFDAIDFAVRAHNGQFRKGTNIPYIVHPIGVMQKLLQYTNNTDVVCAGILHDTLEDTQTTEQDIKNQFGNHILELVKAVSEPDKSLSWIERKKHTIEYLNNINDTDILMVCCADKLNNIQSMLQDYKKIGDQLWDRFNQGQEKQKWYYTELAKIFAKHINTSKLFDEYITYVKKLFN